MFPPGNTVGVVQGHLMEYTVYNPSGDLLYLIQRDATVCCGRTGYQVRAEYQVRVTYQTSIRY